MFSFSLHIIKLLFVIKVSRHHINKIIELHHAFYLQIPILMSLLYHNNTIIKKETIAPPNAPPKYRRCITLHPGIGSGYSSFYGQLQSSLFFHKKERSTHQGQYLFLFYNSIIRFTVFPSHKLCFLRSFPVTM